MSHPPQQPADPLANPWVGELNEAYHRGYLDGHLAGWTDAAAKIMSKPGVAPVPQQSPEPVQAAVPNTAVPKTAVPSAPVSAPVQAAVPGRVPVPERAYTGHQNQDFTQFAPAQHLGITAHQHQVQPPAPQPQAPAFPPRYGKQSVVPALSPADVAAKKAKRETQNINVTLYVASLLMVAAAALFVASTLPEAARLAGVWTGTAVFYGVGLLLHAKSPRLKPAAVAFVGTALAIIPFAGIATYNLGFPQAPAVWLLTSVLGTVAYIFAAVRLSSKLIVYLSIAFLLSTAWSSVAVLGAALAWYFTALILFSAALSLVGQQLRKKSPDSDSKASLYAKPLSDLGPWFAPIGILSSLAFALGLNAADHSLVLIAGVVYFAVMTGVGEPSLRRWNFLGACLSLTLAAPFVGWLIGESSSWAAGALVLALAVQVIIVGYLLPPLAVWLGSAAWVRRGLLVAIPLLAMCSLAWSVILKFSQYDGASWALSPVVPLAVGLVAAMVVVPVFLPHGEWLPLPALLVSVCAASILQAQDWTILLALALIYAVLRFALTRVRWLRQVMLVAARLLVTALVASIMAAYVPAQLGKIEIIIAVVTVIAAGQLLTDSLLARFGAPSRVAAISGLAWAVVGTVFTVFLTVSYVAMDFGGYNVSVPALVQFCFALGAGAMVLGVAISSWLLLPRGGGYLPSELVAPIALAIISLGAGIVFDAAGAVLGWGLLVLFFVAMGLCLSGQSSRMHRAIYWWAARATSLLLAIAVFQLWGELTSTPSVGNAEVTLALVLLLFFIPQLLILAFSLWNKITPVAVVFDVCITLGLVFIVATSQATSASSSQWAGVIVLGLVVAAMAALSLSTVHNANASLTLLWVPALMTVLVIALQAGHVRSFEVTLAILVVSAVFGSLFGAVCRVRSVSFLLGRVAGIILVPVVISEFTENSTILTLVITALLIAELGVQWLTHSPQVAPRVGDPLILRISLWLLLAFQVIVPIYYSMASGLPVHRAVYRWVLVLELVLLALTSVAAQSVFRQRGASFLAIVSVMGVASVMAPVLWPGTVALILAALSVAVTVWRLFYPARTLEMRWYWLVATLAFLLTAAVVDDDAPAGIFAITWLVAGLTVITVSALQRIPWLTLPGALMVLVAGGEVYSQVRELTQMSSYGALVAFVVVVGVLYLLRHLPGGIFIASPMQLWSLVLVALGSGVCFALLVMANRSTILWGALALTVVAALACMEASVKYRRIAIDIAILAMALVWFWASSVFVDLGVFWLVQWCAAAFGAIALIRYVAQQENVGRNLMTVSASLATFGGVLTFFSGNPLQQLVSLLLFVALLVVGLTVDERRFTIWAAIGVATAVLWYIRGYTYVLLAILALGLIGFAIWRLNRKKPNDAGSPAPLPGTYPAPEVRPAGQAQPQFPPAQYPPAQYPPAQYPPAQYPPAQYPPAQYPPAQYPPTAPPPQ